MCVVHRATRATNSISISIHVCGPEAISIQMNAALKRLRLEPEAARPNDVSQNAGAPDPDVSGLSLRRNGS